MKTTLPGPTIEGYFRQPSIKITPGDPFSDDLKDTTDLNKLSGKISKKANLENLKNTILFLIDDTNKTSKSNPLEKFNTLKIYSQPGNQNRTTLLQAFSHILFQPQADKDLFKLIRLAHSIGITAQDIKKTNSSERNYLYDLSKDIIFKKLNNTELSQSQSFTQKINRFIEILNEEGKFRDNAQEYLKDFLYENNFQDKTYALALDIAKNLETNNPSPETSPKLPDLISQTFIQIHLEDNFAILSNDTNDKVAKNNLVLMVNKLKLDPKNLEQALKDTFSKKLKQNNNERTVSLKELEKMLSIAKEFNLREEFIKEVEDSIQIEKNTIELGNYINQNENIDLLPMIDSYAEFIGGVDKEKIQKISEIALKNIATELNNSNDLGEEIKHNKLELLAEIAQAYELNSLATLIIGEERHTNSLNYDSHQNSINQTLRNHFPMIKIHRGGRYIQSLHPQLLKLNQAVINELTIISTTNPNQEIINKYTEKVNEKLDIYLKSLNLSSKETPNMTQNELENTLSIIKDPFNFEVSDEILSKIKQEETSSSTKSKYAEYLKHPQLKSTEDHIKRVIKTAKRTQGEVQLPQRLQSTVPELFMLASANLANYYNQKNATEEITYLKSLVKEYSQSNKDKKVQK